MPYIVKQDDLTKADYWEVDTIKDTSVILKHDDVELVLEFSGN